MNQTLAKSGGAVFAVAEGDASLTGMQIPGLLAAAVLVSAALAGCSAGAHDPGETSEQATSTSSSASRTTPSPRTTATAAPTAAPAAGAAMTDVIRWIEAGPPADPGTFHSATLDGTSTALGDGIAFVTAGDEANCVTNPYAGGALACLVKLTNPPPRPPDFPSAWKNNWVDFDGNTAQVGSPHGDPGPFINGSGAELARGQSLAFGDYRCRADATGLFCVNYAHQSAVRMSPAGIEPFGCLQKATPPPDIGIEFSC